MQRGIVVACVLAVLGCSEPESGVISSAPLDEIGLLGAPAAASRSAPELEQRASLRAAYIAMSMKEAAEDPSYAIAPAGGGKLLAKSRPGQVIATFDDRGALVEANSGQWQGRIDLASAGCREAVSEVSPVPPVPDEGAANRLSYARRAGSLRFREYWMNGDLGLEQSFVVDEASCRDMFRVELEADGLRPTLQDGAVELGDEFGLARLRYGDLYAYDSAGKYLPARLHTDGDRVAIDVEVRGATWPIVIDPLLVTQDAKLSQNFGKSNDGFGTVVALDGDTALIARPWTGPLGAAWGMVDVFVRQGNFWGLQQTLKPPEHDPAEVDRFGAAMALSGDVALIGGIVGTSAAMDWHGAVHVFVRSGGSWTMTQTLASPDADFQDGFGTAIALSGNRALIGDHMDDEGGNYAQGAAHTFVHDGVEWQHEKKLVAEGGGVGDQFGTSVALDGDYAIIGAPWHWVSSRVYVFAREDVDWVQKQMIAANNQSHFGWSVALSGDRALIGEPTVCGAYLYARTGDTWALETELEDPDDGCFDNYGARVALQGDRALVGASEKSVGNNAAQGAAYLFEVVDGDWVRVADLFHKNPTANDGFGLALALSGELAFIGSMEDVGQNPYQGAVHIFAPEINWMGQRFWVEKDRLVASDGNGGDQFGVAVAIEGDRALIGASQWHEELGAVYFYVRGDKGWEQKQRLVASDSQGAARFGLAVAMHGDRAIIGASGVDFDHGAQDNRGAVYFFAFDGAAWVEEQRFMPSAGAGLHFGHSVAMAEGRALVGAPGDSEAGRAYLLTHNGAIWVAEQQLSPDTTVANTQFGHSVALEGETAVVAAPFQDPGGAVHVFSRNDDVWQLEQKVVAPSAVNGDTFGWSVALSRDSLLVGVPELYKSGNGFAWVFTRNGGEWTEQEKLFAADGQLFDAFGGSVVLQGDTALIGAANFDGVPPMLQRGAAYVFVRSEGRWYEQEPRLMASDGTASDFFGRAVAITGSTALISAPVDYVDEDSGVGSVYALTLTGLAGSVCQIDEDCAISYFCVDGVCCTSECEGACEVCSAARGAVEDGTCTPKAAGQSGDVACDGNVRCDGISGDCPPLCENDEDCPAEAYCAQGDCILKKPQGRPCDGSNECSTAGGCASGFCCNETCTRSCEVCSAALGTGEDGVCSPKNAATAGNPACPGDILCDGMARECPTECTSDADCDVGDFCELESATCKPKKPDGARCVGNSECSNAHCEDGVCCESACDGQCEWCAEPSMPGQCVAVEGQPQGARAPCTGAGTLCGGTCNGAERDGCEFPGGGTACGDPATCENDSVRAQSTCDGAGQCQRGALADCGTYTCDTELIECKTSCATSVDCRLGAGCDTSEGVGTCSEQGTRCEGGYQVRTSDGVVSSCQGYLCVADSCQQQCTTESGCAPGYACVDRQCSPTAAETSQDSGCGCRVGSASKTPGTGPALGLLALVLLAVRKRRRRCRNAAA